MAMTREQSKIASRAIYDKLTSDDASLFKEAQQGINEFTRLKMREKGFMPHLMEPQTLTNDELDRQYWTPLPVKVVDMEVDVPASISVPLGSTPMQYFIQGRRYMVMMERVLTPKMVCDVDSLRTYHMDIRQIFADNILKDMETELDTKGLGAVDFALGSVGTTLPHGTIQNVQISGGISRESIVDAMNVQADTPFSIGVGTCLINNITFTEFLKWRRDEFGGDIAADTIRQGVSVLKDILGRKWVVTIKRALVPNKTLYTFGPDDFLGKYFQLEDVTMYMKREYFMLEFFAYMYGGMTWAHNGAFAKVAFTV